MGGGGRSFAGRPGLIHPDEHYQGLEVAHFLLYGYGDLTWEWHVSSYSPIRSILFPMQLALIMKLVSLFTSNYELILLSTRIWTALLSSILIPLMISFVFFLLPIEIDKKIKTKISLFVGVFVSFNYLLLKYSWHTFSNVYILPIMIASLIPLFLKANNKKVKSLYLFIGGFFCSYVIILRPEMLVFYGIFIIIFLPSFFRKINSSWILGVIIGLIYNGLIDFFYYHIFPFTSILNYFFFQQSRSDFYGIEPFGYYSNVFIFSNIIIFILFCLSSIYLLYDLLSPIFICRNIKAFYDNILNNPLLSLQIKLLTLVFTILMIWEMIPHKEERFLLFWYLFLIIYCTLGSYLFFFQLWKNITKIALKYGFYFKNKKYSWLLIIKYAVILIFVGLIIFDNLALFSITDSSPFQELESSVLFVGQQNDLTGLVVVFPAPHYVGTMAYLHRDVPVLRILNQPYIPNFTFLLPKIYNYIIIPRELYNNYTFIPQELMKYNFIVERTIEKTYPVDIWHKIL
ncbi:MAG: hypothetical protein ACFFD1_05585 [Candidatus Thorarchaeota archaeon]